MSTSSSRNWRDESGIALVSVMLAVIILGGLAAVFIATALGQTRASGIGRDHENAVHVAEASTDVVIVNLNSDLAYHTTYDVGGSHIHLKHDGTDYAVTDEKAWARAIADSAASSDLTSSGGGQGYAIRPVDSASKPMDVVYGVGYVPSRAAALDGRGQVRVLKLQVQPSVFSPADAFLVNGDLTLGGGANTAGITGNVHANGNVFIEGNAGDCASSGLCVRGRLSMTGTLRKGPAPTGPEHTGTEQAAFDNAHVCPIGDTAPTCGTDDVLEDAARKEVPAFNAISYYDPRKTSGMRLASYTDPNTGNVVEARWWILCPNGKVYKPAFSDDPTNEVPYAPGVVCSGTVGSAVWEGQTANFHGWSFTGNTNCAEFGKPCWNGDKVVTGAYFVYDSNARTQGGQGAVSILVSCKGTPGPPDPADGKLWDREAETCDPATGAVNGNYSMSGQPSFVPAIRGIHFLADRDILVSGQSGTKLDGFIGAREQVATSGSGDLNGTIVALALPTTTGSPVALSNAKGSFRVSYNERMLIALPGVTQITAWNEL